MKTSPVLLLTILVVGCHFDKLFNDSSGGAASRAAAPTATHLIFITEPSNTPAGTIITPPVRVAGVNDHLEIWDRAAWHDHVKLLEGSAEDVAERLASQRD